MFECLIKDTVLGTRLVILVFVCLNVQRMSYDIVLAGHLRKDEKGDRKVAQYT